MTNSAIELGILLPALVAGLLVTATHAPPRSREWG
jgi:hypothetical protein